MKIFLMIPLGVGFKGLVSNEKHSLIDLAKPPTIASDFGLCSNILNSAYSSFTFGRRSQLPYLESERIYNLLRAR